MELKFNKQLGQNSSNKPQNYSYNKTNNPSFEV